MATRGLVDKIGGSRGSDGGKERDSAAYWSPYMVIGAHVSDTYAGVFYDTVVHLAGSSSFGITDTWGYQEP